MIITDTDIISRINRGSIVIKPFDIGNLGTNSYDVHLGSELQMYRSTPLDCKKRNETVSVQIPEHGYVLSPGTLYLGVTQEYTESLEDVPLLEGKSSVGRLGIKVHMTAGFGDIGFKGHWTLEIEVVEAVRVYAGMPIAQLYWVTATSSPTLPYNVKPFAKYGDQPARPVPSKMYLNFK